MAVHPVRFVEATFEVSARTGFLDAAAQAFLCAAGLGRREVIWYFKKPAANDGERRVQLFDLPVAQPGYDDLAELLHVRMQLVEQTGVAMIKTRFTEMFDLDHPIMSAPMGLAHSDGALAAAVTEAGALGTFGAMSDAPDAEWACSQMAVVRERTSRPFGVGFITHFLEHGPQLFDAVIEQKPPVVVLSFADPEPWLSRAKDAGAKVICQVQTYELAQAAVDAGADVIAAQGNEAGGHTGVMGLLPFLSRLREAFPHTPLLAAGGIGDARALAGVLAAGADGAWMGTVFLATSEAPVAESFKDAIVGSDGGDTVFSKIPDMVFGAPWPEPIAVRLRRNRFMQRWLGREDEVLAQQPAIFGEVFEAMRRGDADEGMVLYGPAASGVDRVRPVAEVVQRISEGAERILREDVAALLSSI